MAVLDQCLFHFRMVRLGSAAEPADSRVLDCGLLSRHPAFQASVQSSGALEQKENKSSITGTGTLQLITLYLW